MLTISNDARPRVRAFAADLEELCKRHGLQLAVEGYDALQVWQLRPGEEAVHAPCIEDCTDGAEWIALPSPAAFVLCKALPDHGQWDALAWHHDRATLEAEAKRREWVDYEVERATDRPGVKHLSPDETAWRRYWVDEVPSWRP